MTERIVHKCLKPYRDDKMNVHPHICCCNFFQMCLNCGEFVTDHVPTRTNTFEGSKCVFIAGSLSLPSDATHVTKSEKK